MKRTVALLLILAVLFSVTSCGINSDKTEQAEETTAAAKTDADLAAYIENQLADIKYDGIIYVTHNGNIVYQRATGTDANGDPLTIDTSMYIGSVSKQFCAAAVMILRDQGKLRLDDTINKYFPEYDKGKDITIKHLLIMRSGIRDTVNEGYADTLPHENSEEENTSLIKKWIFNQTLLFEPDSAYRYSNSNYILLADIVEQVSGQYYNDFLREHIFDPLDMKHTGLITEIPDSPAWAEKLIYDEEVNEVKIKGIAKGAGDIVSNAPDMVKWMEGLSDGKIVTSKTLREMVTDYSPDSGQRYGYGLMPMFAEGAGHEGAISSYSSTEYFNPKSGYCLFCDSNGRNPGSMAWLLLGEYLYE